MLLFLKVAFARPPPLSNNNTNKVILKRYIAYVVPTQCTNFGDLNIKWLGDVTPHSFQK